MENGVGCFFGNKLREEEDECILMCIWFGLNGLKKFMKGVNESWIRGM